MKLSINRVKKFLFFFVIAGLAYWVLSWPFLNLELHELVEHAVEHVPFDRELRMFLTERLVKVDASPYTLGESSPELGGVIYVMGGSQESLAYRFRTAAELYHLGLCKRVLSLSRQGITQYDPLLGRNLTNNEWAIRKLVDYGVNKEDIELVAIKKAHFGTFSEARGISDIALKRGYKNLILVTSSCHTMRTWLSFSKVLKDKAATLHIYAANDPISVLDLLIEYFKLFVYRNVVLPIYYYARKLN